MIDTHHGWNASSKPIILGFVISIILVFSSYQIVVYRHLAGWVLTSSVLGLGFFQALMQLIFFFHIGLEDKPRWKLAMFLFMIFLAACVVLGSIWIMKNISSNVMIPMPSHSQ